MSLLQVSLLIEEEITNSLRVIGRFVGNEKCRRAIVGLKYINTQLLNP